MITTLSCSTDSSLVRTPPSPSKAVDRVSACSTGNSRLCGNGSAFSQRAPKGRSAHYEAECFPGQLDKPMCARAQSVHLRQAGKASWLE